MTDVPIRVLVADPSPIQRRAAQAFLPLAGMEVTTAAGGLDAWDLFRSLRPQVLLTETVLSGLSGLELIHRCKQESPSTRILAFTAASAECASSAAFLAGADHVLLKPADWGQVLSAVRSLTWSPARQFAEVLLAHGAPPHWAGLGQCARCAELLALRRCSLLKEVYLQVAREEHTSPSCVSKNVERLIKALSPKGSLAFLGFAPTSPPPCNKDFLTALSRSATFPL